MKLILLGTSGFHPNDRRHTACLFLPEVGVVLDAGSGLYRLPEYLATDHLDIFLSHAHLDHVVGLTYIMDLVPKEMLSQITLHAEESKLAAVREHLFSESLFPVLPPFRREPLQGAVALPQGGTLTHFPLEHPGGALGFRLDWPGHSMAYVTDTTATPGVAYLEKIKGVDLLVHEAFCTDDQAAHATLTGHSCLTPAAQVAADAGAGKMALVHINPNMQNDEELDLDSVRHLFANLCLGTDRMELEF